MMNTRTLEVMYTELAALKLEKKLAETAEAEGEPSDSEVKETVWCYWNGEVVDAKELAGRLLIEPNVSEAKEGCESASDLSVSTSPSASEIHAPSSLAQVSSPLLRVYPPLWSDEEILAHRATHPDEVAGGIARIGIGAMTSTEYAAWNASF